MSFLGKKTIAAASHLIIEVSRYWRLSLLTWRSSFGGTARSQFSKIFIPRGQEAPALEHEGVAALSYAKDNLRRPFAAVLFLSVIINALALITPIYMTQVYDRVLTSYSIETLVVLTLLALGLTALLVILDRQRSRILARSALKAEQILAPALITAAVHNQIIGRVGSIQPLRDLSALRGLVTGPSIASLFDAPLVPLYILVIFAINAPLGTMMLVGALAMSFLAWMNQRSTGAQIEDGNRATNALMVSTELQIRNSDVVHTMGLATALKGIWTTQHDRSLQTQLEVIERGSLWQIAIRYVRLALQILTLGIGAALVIDDHFTAGMMFAASTVIARGLQPIETAVGSWRSLVSARGNYGRICDALSRVPSVADAMALPPPSGKLDVENVSLIIGAERRRIFSGVTLSLAPGEILGIIGPAASGKSSLARTILGAWPPSGGTVRLDGADIAQWPRSQLGPHLGYLPQEVELFPATVAQNIARMGSPNADAVVSAARWAGVHEMILRLPKGYDTPIMAGGLIISPGQRQRIGLARAFYGNPKLIVLDEPNANLDGEGEEALGKALSEAAIREVTVIVIAHRLGILQHTHKILLLRDGTVQAMGSRDEILPRLMSKNSSQIGTVVPLVNTAVVGVAS